MTNYILILWLSVIAVVHTFKVKRRQWDALFVKESFYYVLGVCREKAAHNWRLKPLDKRLE